MNSNMKSWQMNKLLQIKPFFLLILTTLMACSVSETNKSHTSPPADFLTSLAPLCNQTYLGKVVSDDPQDEDWRKEVLTLGPISCSDDGVVAMPLAVGDDTSRTWFLRPSENAIEFRHQHLLKNGDIDPVSDYGGYSADLKLKDGAWQVNFPADPKTVDIFKANGLDVSITNVWSFDYRPKAQLTYELNRENRHFRAEFDLFTP